MQATTLSDQIKACMRCTLGPIRVEVGGKAVPAWYGHNLDTPELERPLLAVMCEAPGAQEEETGLPLVGRAGQLFNKLLHEAGLNRWDLLLMNRVRCRPPANQLKNHPDAVKACDDWSKAELEFYDPKVVVLMGATAIEKVFGKGTVGELRGTVRTTGPDFEWGARTWVATYHPAGLLRPTGKQNIPLVVADLMLAKSLAAA